MSGWKFVPVEPTDEMIDAAIDTESDFYAEIYEAMISAAPGPEWQPIATAPNDGTAVIVITPRKDWPGNPHISVACWQCYGADPQGSINYYEGPWYGWVPWSGYCHPKERTIEPTHWMPLPAMPAGTRSVPLQEAVNPDGGIR